MAGCGAPTTARGGKGDAYQFCKSCHPGAIAPTRTRDWVLDLSVTPDRGYALSIRGLARDLAASLGEQHGFIDPTPPDGPAPEREAYPVEVLDEQACPRFTALRVTGVIDTPRSVLGTVFLAGTGFVGLDGNSIWYVGDGAVRVDTRTSTIVATIHLLDHPSLFAFPSAIVTGNISFSTRVT